MGYSAIVVIVCIAGFMFFRLTQDPDIAFTRQVFAGLVNGRQAVQEAIDWPTLKAVGSDVGADYSRFPTESQRQYFRKSFIINFSLSFQNTGGELKSFTNWHIYSKDNTKTVVACLALSNKTLLFTISKKYGKRKLVSIQWKE